MLLFLAANWDEVWYTTIRLVGGALGVIIGLVVGRHLLERKAQRIREQIDLIKRRNTK